MDEELRGELVRMFNDGDGETIGGTKKKGMQKYTALEARKELSEMKLGRRLVKFGSTSKYGNLPTTGQVTSFWSRFEAKNTAMNAKQAVTANKLEGIPEESVLDEWVGSALLGDGSDGAAISSVNTGRGENKQLPRNTETNRSTFW